MLGLRRTVISLAISSSLVGVVSAAPASAEDRLWPVNGPATVTISGDGDGHGKGMSQYGAYGAARQARTYQQILRFYYPRTRYGETGGQVRVLISGDDDRDLVVDARHGLTVRAPSSGRSWKPDVPRASRWRIRPAGAVNEISYRTSTWHVWRKVRGDAEISAGGRPVTLRTPGGPVAYRGALRSAVTDNGRATVNVLPMEQYLRGVVAAEMYASWPQQALRAQAVASRTYAAYERADRRRAAWDLCDTAACQAYGGYPAESTTSDEAVRTTARRVLTYGGEVAFAQFSASNGGWTVAGQFPYLPAQQDPYEGTSPDYYGWGVTLTDVDIEKAFDLEDLTSIGVETRDGHGGRGGRVETVRLTTSKGWTGTVTGEKFRSKFGMKSTMFTIDDVA